MDLKNKNEYEFLDFNGVDLNDNDRQELRTYLRSNPSSDILKLPWDVGDDDCNENVLPDQEAELHKPWVAYSGEEEMVKYISSGTSGTPLILPQPFYPAMLVTYPPSEWPSNVYVSNDISMQYTAAAGGMSYPPYINPATGNENQDIHSARENSNNSSNNSNNNRRSTRGRGGKRDNYNRNSQNSEIPFYSVPCINEQYTSMFCSPAYPEHTIIPPQQHPAAGQPVFSCITPQIYQQHPMHLQSHNNFPQYHHQAQSNIKYHRHPQPIQTQTNGAGSETVKNTIKSFDKRGQNNPKSFRQTANNDDKNSKQTIRATVIVNNSNMEPFVNNNDGNTPLKNSNCNVSNSNKVPPFNVKIDCNFVSTRNENCNNGNEKNDGPCVNIKSSIEIEQNGDDNVIIDNENESVSHIQQTTVLKTLSPQQQQTSIPVKDDGVENELMKSQQQPNVNPVVPIQVKEPNTTTWAGVLKKKNSDVTSPSSLSSSSSNPVTTKPTAFINPITAESSVCTTRNSLPTHSEPKVVQNKVTPLPAQTQETQEKDTNDRQAPVETNLNAAAQDYDFDDPLTYRMGEFFLNYQMDKQTVSLLPRGLTNRSNYCYINSILQALLACPPFYNLLKALPYSETTTRRSSRTLLIDNMTKFVHEFTPLSEAARMPRKDRGNRRNEDTLTDVHCGIPFEPSYVYTVLKNTSSAGVFSIEGRQEDAEEFLSCLLNGISDEMLEVMKLVNSGDKISNNNPNTNLNSEEEEWQIMGPKNKGSITRCTDFGRTPLSDIFRGQLRSRVHRAGEQPTDYVQPFFTLQLDIEKAESVKSALEILVGKDQVEGMTCSKTKQQIEAWKQVTLEELPVILILHLKWFDYKLDGCSKILKNVEFPVDLKIDPKFLSPNAAKKFVAKQKQYKLFAVTYHDGKEATKGHYVTDAFHVGYGGWVRYDDSSLKGISENNVLNPQLPRVPYLLYYRRCDTIGNNQSNVVKSR